MRRSIFLVIGMLLLALAVLGVVPTAISFVAGMLFVALGLPDTGPHSPTAAMVRTWQWLYGDHAHHP